jgi:hypothetical protein
MPYRTYEKRDARGRGDPFFVLFFVEALYQASRDYYHYKRNNEEARAEQV